MRPRMEQELVLLREHYPDIEHCEHGGEDWFRIPRYPFPAGWRIGAEAIESAPVAFRISAGYPTAEPYGFLAPGGINYNGSSPGNPGGAIAVPFPGAWQPFSWAPDGSWAPTNDVRTGSNLLVWVRGFAQRLSEGA
jgi:hypothetical protein